MEVGRIAESRSPAAELIRCAQIAGVPRGLAHAWDRERLARETVALLRARGAAIRERVVSDVVALDDAPAFMQELAARRRDALQAVFAA